MKYLQVFLIAIVCTILCSFVGLVLAATLNAIGDAAWLITAGLVGPPLDSFEVSLSWFTIVGGVVGFLLFVMSPSATSRAVPSG